MAGKTAKITLGGTEYTVHAFNIGELERVGDAINEAKDSGGNLRASFAILRIALERAEPPVPNMNAIEPDSMDEVVTAAGVIMEIAGLKKAAADPQQGQGAP